MFSGMIGYNIPSTMEEREEDLLERLYLWWKNGERINIHELCMQMDMTKQEIGALMEQMIHHGYLKETKDLEDAQLTEYGRAQGAECQDRHQYLSQFLQMTCGLDEQQAYDNACRIEHIVTGEMMQGVHEYLKFGDMYDRVVRNMDLCSMYDEGNYYFYAGIYYMEKRYPRVLADEFYQFSDKILLEVCEEKSDFYLKDGGVSSCLWYADNRRWKQAEMTEQGFRIPTNVFTFTFSTTLPVTEGNCVIAFANPGELPRDENCRDLNVHIW